MKGNAIDSFFNYAVAHNYDREYFSPESLNIRRNLRD